MFGTRTCGVCSSWQEHLDEFARLKSHLPSLSRAEQLTGLDHVDIDLKIHSRDRKALYQQILTINYI